MNQTTVNRFKINNIQVDLLDEELEIIINDIQIFGVKLRPLKDILRYKREVNNVTN